MTENVTRDEQLFAPKSRLHERSICSHSATALFVRAVGPLAGVRVQDVADQPAQRGARGQQGLDGVVLGVVPDVTDELDRQFGFSRSIESGPSAMSSDRPLST